MAIIALMTDFGMRDHFVATMKGVILQIDPRALIVDVTHEVDPQQVYEAAFTLRQAFPYFPEHTIFVAVVDPTVGTSRRILAARYSNRILLVPDNGVITLIHRDAELQEMRLVENRRFMAGSLSSTFHGRDIFAPVAAHLSKGARLGELGPMADSLELLELAKPAHTGDGALTGEVVYVDRFGNLITNISALDLSAANTPGHTHRVRVEGRDVGPIRIAYADVPAGECVALIGSTEMLEIAVNQGSAHERLALAKGARVTVEP
jgi:S-adenosyl-L-methionine hydrolase (adenosine-forming)